MLERHAGTRRGLIRPQCDELPARPVGPWGMNGCIVVSLRVERRWHATQFAAQCEMQHPHRICREVAAQAGWQVGSVVRVAAADDAPERDGRKVIEQEVDHALDQRAANVRLLETHAESAKPFDVGIRARDRRIRHRQCVDFSQVVRCEQIVVGRDAEVWCLDAPDQRVHVANPAEPFALHNELETTVMKVTPADGLRVIRAAVDRDQHADIGEGLRRNAVERLGEEVRSIEDRHTHRDRGHSQPAAPTSACMRSAVWTAMAGPSVNFDVSTER